MCEDSAETETAVVAVDTHQGCYSYILKCVHAVSYMTKAHPLIHLSVGSVFLQLMHANLGNGRLIFQTMFLQKGKWSTDTL